MTSSIGRNVAAAGLLCFLLGISTHAQEGQSPIVINVTWESPAPTETRVPAEFLNGYAKYVDGQMLQYHSSHPDVDSALIVRARKDFHSIAWQTERLPNSVTGDYYRFVWLAGIESRGWEQDKLSHNWDFLINGRRWFTFRNAKDDSAREWTVAGKDSSELSFHSTMADRFGDLFGYMFLTVPKADFSAGGPLQLEVVGEDSESADWYMTFQYQFNFEPRLRAEPALLRDGTKATQLMRLSLDTLRPGGTVHVTIPGRSPVDAPLSVGANIVRLPIPAVTQETRVAAVFQINGQSLKTMEVVVQPVKPRDFYLLSYSHNDIGYTDLQNEVERKQWRNLDQALELIKKTKSYPPEARYKWNFEVIWALDTYMRQASTQKRQEVLGAIHDGALGVNALYANMLTGLANAEEMSHFVEFARQLRKEYSIPIETAATSDVPGLSWGMVSALSQSGIKYLATAPNSGDRIGYVLSAWGDKPFYWASQSGKEKVLTWVAGASYSVFHEGTLGTLGDEKILKLARHLDDAGYSYEMVHLPYTLGDNGSPDPALSDFVKSWNERYITPRLILATQQQMMQEFERRHGATLPVVKGDFTPYWEDGAASTAAETALARQSVDRLIQAETLWAMRSDGKYPAHEFANAWRNLVLWDEHTWGADKSISDPDSPVVKAQWEFKQRFALEADRQSRALLNSALTGDTFPNAVDVYNTTSWARNDVVVLDPLMSTAGDRVVDSEGNAVPSQRLTTGELALLVDEIPPFSSRRLFVRAGAAFERTGAKVSGTTLENSFLTVAVDPEAGSVSSLRRKPDGVEFVDRAKGELNQYLYVLGRGSEHARSLSNVKVRVKENGPLITSLVVEGTAPGARKYSSEIRVAAASARVDILDSIDKLAVREKESLHFAFPFRVPRGQVRYDVANSIVRPEVDQLPGSCKNVLSAESWVDVSNEDRGITLTIADSPLIEVGGMHAEEPWIRVLEPSQEIYSYVMNNYWHTNYKADQEGLVTFRYALIPHAAFREEWSVRYGTESRQPLLVAAARKSKPTPPLLTMSPQTFLAASIRPIEAENAWLIFVYNPTNHALATKLTWNRLGRFKTYNSDAGGVRGPATGGEISIDAFDSKYVRVQKVVTRDKH